MVFVLFGWGSVVYNKQALLAAKSILARSDSARILVFASHPELFVDEKIKVIPITKFDLTNWRGPLDYIHRPKIYILKKTLLNIDENEPICYLDSDMYCYDMPKEFNVPIDNILMFNYEGRISDSFHPQLHNFLAANRELLDKNGHSDLFPNLQMYNTGLIHMLPSSWRMKALEEVLDLTDFLCIHLPQQMTWLEQASFCHVLPKYSKINAVASGFEHYWGHNSEVGFLLEKMPLRKIEEIAESRHSFDELLNEAKSIQKTATNKLRLFLRRQKRSMLKRFRLLKAKYYIST